MLIAGKYYTRLMSGRLQRTFSLEELSEQTLPIDQAVSLTELERFVEALNSARHKEAKVQCTLSFKQQASGKIAIHGSVATEQVVQQCQRCLEPMAHKVRVDVHWQLPDDMDAYTDATKGGELPSVRLLDWVEDELILSLPLFAKHDDDSCQQLGYLAIEEEVAEAQVTRPFEGLKDLLKK